MRSLPRSADLRLARLHVRGGVLALARAELETLAGADRLDRDGILDLAEVRWRTGDLGGAAAAAAAWLEEGDTGPGGVLAHVIAAEAAAAAGDAAGTAAHVDAAAAGLGSRPALELLLAGIAARAPWPWDPEPAHEATATGADVARSAPSLAASAAPGGGGTRSRPPMTPAAATLVEQGAALLGAAPQRAAIVLALALRADRAAAEGVLAALDAELARHAEGDVALSTGVPMSPDGDTPSRSRPADAALAFVRAEALRAAGRHEEARIAYASAERLALAPAETDPPGSPP